MKRKLFLLTILLPLNCFAIPTAEKVNLAQELVQLTDVFDKMAGPMDNMLKQMPNPYSSKFGADKEKFETIFREKVGKAMKEVMDGIKKDLLPKVRDFYAQQFTQDELQQLVAFYKTPAGKKYIEKSPEIMNKLMPEMQQTIQKKVMTLISDSTMNALQKAKSQGLKNDEIDQLIDQQKKQREMMEKFMNQTESSVKNDRKTAEVAPSIDE